MYANKKSQNAQFCPAARIEMSVMNSHLVENVLANTIKYKQIAHLTFITKVLKMTLLSLKTDLP